MYLSKNLFPPENNCFQEFHRFEYFPIEEAYLNLKTSSCEDEHEQTINIKYININVHVWETCILNLKTSS